MAADRNLAPDTQRVALSAIKFLYDSVLDLDIRIVEFTLSTKPKKPPVVMTFGETEALLGAFHGIGKLQSTVQRHLELLLNSFCAKGEISSGSVGGMDTKAGRGGADWDVFHIAVNH